MSLVAVYLGSREPVEMGQHVGPLYPPCSNEGRKRYHHSLIRPGVQAFEVPGVLPVSGIGLEDNPPDPAVLIVLAYSKGPELRLYGAVDILDRHAEQVCLFTVHI